MFFCWKKFKPVCLNNAEPYDTSFCYFFNFYFKTVHLCCSLMHFTFLIHSFILMFKKESSVPKCWVCAYTLTLQLSIFSFPVHVPYWFEKSRLLLSVVDTHPHVKYRSGGNRKLCLTVLHDVRAGSATEWSIVTWDNHMNEQSRSKADLVPSSASDPHLFTYNLAPQPETRPGWRIPFKTKWNAVNRPRDYYTSEVI